MKNKKNQKEIIREKLLDMINEMEDKQYSPETILEVIKVQLEFNNFEE